MDSRKSKKSSSIRIEPKRSRPTSANPHSKFSSRTHPDSAADQPRLTQSHTSPPSQQRQKEDDRTSEARISDVTDRDSTASIRDDPFFRPYQSPHSNRLASESRHAHGPARRNDDSGKHASLPHVNVVVLGCPRVGKSTFIKTALNLRENASTSCSSKKMSLDGVVYVVRLFELLLNDLVSDKNRGITWPNLIDDKELPPIDGLLILYDITNEASVNEIPDALYGLTKSGPPILLVSCKEDNPPKLRQVDLDFSQQMRSRFSTLETCSTSANVPESHKRCISVILRLILTARKGAINPTPSSDVRNRTADSSVNERQREVRKSSARVKTHYRTTSDISSADPHGPPKSFFKGLNDSPPARNLRFDVSAEHLTSSVSRLSLPDSPVSNSSLSPEDSDDPSPDNQHLDLSSGSESPRSKTILRPDTADSQAHNTFLIMEEESQDEFVHEKRRLSSPKDDMAEKPRRPREETGSSFDDLIDRLLALPMSKQEGKFVPVFLCLYRKFCSPVQVFSAITSRFDQVEQSKNVQLVKVGEQLRYLQVLALWTADYPGDFALSNIKKDALAFVSKLEKSRVFAYAAKEILRHLDHAIENEDAEWSCLDGLDAADETGGPCRTQSEPISPLIRTGQSSTDELPQPSKRTPSEASCEDPTQSSATPSVNSTVFRSSSMSSQSLAGLESREETRQEAQALVPIPRTRLSKVQWHQFVEIPNDEIARELTRMDWILYSSIRPRDLVRSVSLANSANKMAKRLGNVDQMINHFNHVFCFVSGMILMRDKPTHRARMLEKWMAIAWKVRQMNNYYSLGAIIAGTNGTAVHRLGATWELVPEQVRKGYLRLTILMGTTRSHGAYRMAWENSFTERIPFLPVYRKDLVAAETGNRTMVGPRGERINWKKFEVMGEVILSMQRSQDKPYKLPKNGDVMKLVLETQISHNEEDVAEVLYERSLQLEPAGSGVDTSRKKFDWLRR